MLDVTYRLQIPHRAGQLARVTTVISKHEGLIGDILTVSLHRDSTEREITVEMRDAAHAWALANDLNALEGVRVIWHHDRAFLRHEGGKLRIDPIRPVKTVQEMRDVYTPGVARVCSAIADNPALVSRYTMIGRTVAVCTNGTRVLGLGDIGPRASMPVMEGKAVFYQQFAGLSAMPILIDTKDEDEFVETVVRIAPTFAGIHLEDISAPMCFEIERRLIERLPQPVMHDDVHGTAVVTVAAAIAACRHVGRRLDESVVGQIGLGAAGYGISSLMHDGGARVIAFDPDPRSHDRARAAGVEIVGMDELLATADVVVATTGRPGLIAPEQVRAGSVVLALTNPVGEIEPLVARAAGAAFAADGRSVNNVLAYPGIFRGALLAGSDRITTKMKLAAAWAIAALAADGELVPDVLDQQVHDAVAEAVRAEAVAEGLGRPEVVPAGL
ncbi:NAD-dependent malic enzyme [Paraconexibacter antarcticus]|uniref:NAD-dependent malic enzyme n=1 Tax=Paraconexibacter antarcticus TaxID=2949664 RepID=A0ABY5DNQ7_9ACTN|nr:NAD(P)-dependent oxidoreductase [Paraconexibacter antarcticus]UTI62818.1 NAD-dependent malic enzyme [Paraconexibacter antarcticus]